MIEFTYEERFLIEAYGGGTRTDTIDALTVMRSHLESDETELRELADSTIRKLDQLSDAAYQDTLDREDDWSPFPVAAS